MAARLARQRQQRSMLRTSNMPDLAEPVDGAMPPVMGSELQILRAEVAESGDTISRLQTQLKQSEAEMEEMGSRTARMAEELRVMRERAEAHAQQQGGHAPAPAADISDDGPMAVSISLPEGDGSGNLMAGVQVQISIAASPRGAKVSVDGATASAR